MLCPKPAAALPLTSFLKPVDHLAPHDLRRRCAKLRHVNGGDVQQIQFLLGHVSVLATERYLGCKQSLEEPVNDRFGCLYPRPMADLR